VRLHRIKAYLADAAVRAAWRLFPKKAESNNCVPIIFYHRVLPEFAEDEDDPIYALRPEQFESQMEFLAKAGFISLSLEEYAEAARGLRPVASRSVMVTFDDGYADNFAVAWPIARKYNIKLNLFISTGFIGEANPIIMGENGYQVVTGREAWGAARNRVQEHLRKFPQLWRPLNWTELGKMVKQGVQIGLHSHRHQNLASLTPEALRADIRQGLRACADQLGLRPRFFALPYGGYDSYTEEVIRILKESGFDLTFSTHPGRALLPSDAYLFPRLEICQRDSLAAFHRKLSGAWDWWAKVRRLNHLARQIIRKIGKGSKGGEK